MSVKNAFLCFILRKKRQKVVKILFLFIFWLVRGFFFQVNPPKLIYTLIFWSYWAKKLSLNSIPFDDLFSYPIITVEKLKDFSVLLLESGSRARAREERKREKEREQTKKKKKGPAGLQYDTDQWIPWSSSSSSPSPSPKAPRPLLKYLLITWCSCVRNATKCQRTRSNNFRFAWSVKRINHSTKNSNSVELTESHLVFPFILLSSLCVIFHLPVSIRICYLVCKDLIGNDVFWHGILAWHFNMVFWHGILAWHLTWHLIWHLTWHFDITF